jgi:hypothetical protein
LLLSLHFPDLLLGGIGLGEEQYLFEAVEVDFLGLKREAAEVDHSDCQNNSHKWCVGHRLNECLMTPIWSLVPLREKKGK